jgi:hypothetical protein
MIAKMKKTTTIVIKSKLRKRVKPIIIIKIEIETRIVIMLRKIVLQVS